VSPEIETIILFVKLNRMPQCSEFEATCFRYLITNFGSPTVGLYEGNGVRLHVDFVVLPVIVMSALFDVLTSVLLISSLLLGYSALLAAELKDVPKDRGVFIFIVSFLTSSCWVAGRWRRRHHDPSKRGWMYLFSIPSHATLDAYKVTSFGLYTGHYQSCTFQNIRKKP